MLEQVLTERRHIMLSEEVADEFFAALDAPAEPVTELVDVLPATPAHTVMRLEPLDADHRLTGSSCSVAELDDWLRRHALDSQRMDSARTFVTVADTGQACGCFSLTMGSVAKAAVPTKLVRGLPAYPVGAVILARLAVAVAHQGTGLGARLFAEALRMAVAAGEIVAARLVVVLDDAAAKFSQRFGFIALPESCAAMCEKTTNRLPTM